MLPNTNPAALESLGWSSFQDLAVAYVEDLLNAKLVVYSKARDLGSDGQESLFTPSEADSPRRVIQAKHTTTLEPLSPSRFAPELEKLPKLAAEGFGGYLLVTNHIVSRETAVALGEKVRAAGFTQFEIHGRDQIERRIRESPMLRAMVPRLYGIGDLSLILDERLIAQTQVLLATSKPDLQRFVATDAYRESVRALGEQGILVLLGAPAAGKSTIARALSIAAIDAYGATPVVLQSLDRLADNWNPHDPARLFWADDVFGATQVRAGAADDFNRLAPTLNAALAQGCRFVLTSRTHIWRAVADQLKLSATPRLGRAIVEIKVEEYSVRDRAQIVYNHVKQGDQSREWRKRFKRLAPLVAEHSMFTPEVARRFGLAAFAGHLEPTRTAIDTFVSNPGAYLEEVIGSLPRGEQAALALILMCGSTLPLADPPGEPLDLIAKAYAVSPSQIMRALQTMEGAFCVKAVVDGEPNWRFRHPTIGEAVATVAARSPELLDVYLRGTNVNRILEEAVCAGVQVQGAIIEIGVSRYDILIGRLRAAGALVEPRQIRWFLTTKATPEFRRRYLGGPITIEHRLIGWGWESRAQTLALLAVLKEEGLIDPKCLKDVRGRILGGILERGIADCLSGWSRTILGAEDFDNAVAEAAERLRCGGSDYIENWTPTGAERRETAPLDAFRGLTDFVERLEEFIDPEEAAEVLAVIETEIDERAAAIQAELDEEDAWHREEEYFYRSQNPEPLRNASAPARSFLTSLSPRDAASTADIFSDIDD